ncbi:MAG: S9 family peptidase [Clostridia bacterium]|nr:S9 family peptidase [Clostridia bacterium]
MRLKKRILSVLVIGAVLLSGCGISKTNEETKIETQLDKIDMTQWQYNEENDVYWQSGIVYCENPADETYENLGIYVPGAYMTGTENDDGTYTCEINTSGTVEGYTAETAPIVIPVDTPGYAAMSAPTGYADSTSSYTDAGFIYVYAGCRGREAGAPAGVTDLKAAIRYIRYNDEIVPGSTDRIFSFGMSGGGAQSALLGATGDSELYTPYLEAIGAVSGVSDAVAGSMCWCPITNLDYASEAYEWNLGVTRTDLTEEMQELSDAMAEQFALYVNELGLTDENGNTLQLVASEDGIYQAGSYYDYLKTVIEESLNNFLADTTFPYSAASSGKGGNLGDFGDMPDGDIDENADFGGRGGKENLQTDGELDGKEIIEGKGGTRGELPELDDADSLDDGIERNETSGGISLSGTYETAQDYIDALNEETTWVTYDSETNTATITSIADFVSALKIASKDLGAFDALDESQGENILFGDGDGEGDHFDAVMAQLLEDSDYGAEFAEDLERTDALGTSVADRINMYTPLYYLSDYYDGYQTSNVASFWRIRTGINQSDTALTTEVNLALALENYGADVDFETVWGQGHVEAERTGDSTTNFIDWVTECCQK